MKYLSGIHALNIPCSLDTCGDWHASGLRWESLYIKDTDISIFGSYGLEYDKIIPFHDNLFIVANHIRAILDLLEDGVYSVAQGCKNDFICNDSYTELLFSQVLLLSKLSTWKSIDSFMSREYKLEWVSYKKGIRI